MSLTCLKTVVNYSLHVIGDLTNNRPDIALREEYGAGLLFMCRPGQKSAVLSQYRMASSCDMKVFSCPSNASKLQLVPIGWPFPTGRAGKVIVNQVAECKVSWQTQ